MNNFAQKRVNSPKKPYNIPSFLQNRQQICSQIHVGNEARPSEVCEEFQRLFVTNLHLRNVFRQRADSSIKNTPKVIICDEKDDYLEVLIQNPKKLLIDSYINHRRSVKIQKTLEIITTLFKLSEIYGNYYCDKMMIRENSQGTPVIWIHKRFRQNQREFPIRQSTVSELMFIKKIKQIIDCLIQLPKNLEIETKQKLLAYVQLQKNKAAKFTLKTQLQNTLAKTQLISVRLLRQQSHRSINLKKQKSLKSSKVISKVKNEKKTQTFYLSPNKELKSDRSKKYYEFFDKNRDRTKTGKIQAKQKICDGGSAKNKKSEKASNLKLSRFNEESSEQNSKRKQLKAIKFLSSNVLKQSERLSQKEDTIQQQFEFESEIMEKKKFDPKKHKERKQSADYNIVSSWLHKQTNKQISFPHSTFSTGISFHSINVDLENLAEQQKELKTEVKTENIVINHLYSNNKDKQTKQKMNENIRKIMRQSGMKIAEQDSFQTEFQHIMNPDPSREKLAPSQRSSAIIQQFQQLFDSFRKDQHLQSSFTKDFQNLLN